MDLELEELSEEAWGRWFARRGRLDISLLLFAVWDPIGVADAPEAYDEYDSYAAACLAAVRADDAAQLSQTLAQIENSSMGFSTPPEKLANAAATMVSAARASAQRWVHSHV